MTPVPIYVPIPPFFSFKECLWFLDRGFDECLYRIDNDKVTKAVKINGETVVFSVSEQDHQLRIDTFNVKDTHTILTVKKYVISWFDLERDLAPFYENHKKDPVLSSLLNSYQGLRLIGIEDLFESLCWAVIGQQINLTFAYRLKRRLVEYYGETILHEGQTFNIFPSPAAILGSSHEKLVEMQFSRQKATYIRSLAQVFYNKSITKDQLKSQDISNVLDQLKTLKGIGPWTAHYVAMKCLKFQDAFPVQDAGLVNAIKNQLNMPIKPTTDEIVRLANSWLGWRAYATLYLWRSLSDLNK